MEYKADEETELREAVEKGRRAKIAYEVLHEFLNGRRESIIHKFETSDLTDDNVRWLIAALQVMHEFRNILKRDINFGEYAEERMNEIGR